MSAPEPHVSSPQPRGRLGSLDLFRGLLALSVASYHLSVWFGLTEAGTRANMVFAKIGNFGVSGFFLLSGFLIFRLTSWEDLRRDGLGAFYLKRYLRLAPLFYAAVALNLAFALGMGPEPSPRMLLENLTLTFGAIHPNHALVIGGWYVGLVALFYAAFPLLAWLRARLGLAFLVLVTGALWAWSLPSTLHGVMEAPAWERFHRYVQPENQLFLLLLGGLAADLSERVGLRLRPWAFLLVLGLLLIPIFRMSPWFGDHLVVMTGWTRYRYVLVMLGFLLAFASFSWPPRPWTLPLRWAGQWSYGAYLGHPFFYYLLRHRVGGVGGFLMALALSFGAAALADRFIEGPIQRWQRKRPVA